MEPFLLISTSWSPSLSPLHHLLEISLYWHSLLLVHTFLILYGLAPVQGHTIFKVFPSFWNSMTVPFKESAWSCQCPSFPSTNWISSSCPLKPSRVPLWGPCAHLVIASMSWSLESFGSKGCSKLMKMDSVSLSQSLFQTAAGGWEDTAKPRNRVSIQ